MAKDNSKPRIGVFKFASCDGCQLSLLNLEDELLALAAKVEIAYFLEATRRPLRGTFDITLVEGSISAPEQVAQIHDVRKRSKFLITIGACATAGGIQALRNWANIREYLRLVYAKPEYIATLRDSVPISEYVEVDFELRGCPVSKQGLLETLTALLAGRRPNIPRHSVCIECKRQGIVCLAVARNVPCLGPVTQAGCGALCPSFGRGCYGCYGPAADTNAPALIDVMKQQGQEDEQIQQMLHTFNAWAPAFRQAYDQNAENGK